MTVVERQDRDRKETHETGQPGDEECAVEKFSEKNAKETKSGQLEKGDISAEEENSKKKKSEKH